MPNTTRPTHGEHCATRHLKSLNRFVDEPFDSIDHEDGSTPTICNHIGQEWFWDEEQGCYICTGNGCVGQWIFYDDGTWTKIWTFEPSPPRCPNKRIYVSSGTWI